ncbi:GNAT family protein [Salinibaculum salinum]|uniref:GNAT family N-acetyltransferase n=1 Tax=Salinibaculum salinum TaxID=3131996 RepID=UPI0030EB4C86
MPGPAFREGEQVELRPVEPNDYDFLVSNANTRDIRLVTDTNRPLIRDDVAGLVEADDSVHFLVCVDGDPVGTVWLFHETALHGRAEVGYWITAGERGEGYATEAVTLLTEYATAERRLRRLLARVFEGNDASKRVLETVGFKQEGTLREHYYVDGEFLDATLYGWVADGS